MCAHTDKSRATATDSTTAVPGQRGVVRARADSDGRDLRWEAKTARLRACVAGVTVDVEWD